MDFKERFNRFLEEVYPGLEDLFRDLVERGQRPQAMVVSCSDSRVVPELITSSKPGDMFVVRTIANMVPPYDSPFCALPAAVDYGVEHLGISKLVVLGHSQCGGIKALLAGGVDGSIARWLELGKEVLTGLENKGASSSQERQEMAERLNVEVQLKRFLTYPSVKRAMKEGKLALEGWYYKLYPPDLELVISL